MQEILVSQPLGTIQKKKYILYPKASWFFALAMLATAIGFSRSYFGRLGEVTIYHHLHGAIASSWMLLLIIQPVLYQRDYLKLHRRLGWFAAFVIVPLLIGGGLKMIRLMFVNANQYPPGVPYQLSFIDVYTLLFFTLCFALAIRNGRKLQLHARYMASTVLVILPPGLARLLFLLPWFHTFPEVLNGSFFIVEAILLILLWDDKRTGRLRKPYILVLGLFLILHIATNFAAQWYWWHQAMDAFVGLRF